MDLLRGILTEKINYWTKLSVRGHVPSHDANGNTQCGAYLCPVAALVLGL